jgi:integrase
MASITKRGDSYRVRLMVNGVVETGTFSTKSKAQAWAAEMETQLRKAKETGISRGKTVQKLFDRYADEVSIHKAGERWESLRLTKIAKDKIDGVALGDMALEKLSPEIFGKWRDQRMKMDKVKGSTVQREFKLLSNVFNVGKDEWRWIAENPISKVRRPKGGKDRDRLISDDEIRRISLALGFNEKTVTTKNGIVAIAFLFAIETGMRSGEILGLTGEDIKGRVAHLNKTKNGDERDVALSERAIELLGFLPVRENQETSDRLFDVSDDSRDTLFRNAVKKCKIKELTFHDTRHEAITRLAKKVPILALARMVGHRNINQLQTYYNERAEDIAKLL